MVLLQSHANMTIAVAKLGNTATKFYEGQHRCASALLIKTLLDCSWAYTARPYQKDEEGAGTLTLRVSHHLIQAVKLACNSPGFHQMW